MENIYYNNADYIKSILIDYFSQNNNNLIFGNEIRFGSHGTYADLIMLQNNDIISIEVKAANDDFRGIKDQLAQYRRVYDYFYLVVTENHYKKARANILKNDGLLIVKKNSDVICDKDALIIKSNKKIDILNSMTIDYLKKYFAINTKLKASNFRTKLKNHNLNMIKRAYYFYLFGKLREKNNIFFKEKGIKTHIEDLLILTFNEKLKIF